VIIFCVDCRCQLCY